MKKEGLKNITQTGHIEGTRLTRGAEKFSASSTTESQYFQVSKLRIGQAEISSVLPHSSLNKLMTEKVSQRQREAIKDQFFAESNE